MGMRDTSVGIVEIAMPDVDLGPSTLRYTRRYFPWKVLKAGRLADFTVGFYGGDDVRYVLPFDWAGTDYADGLWREVITMPFEEVEFEGCVVPVWEGDIERREWEARRAHAVS